MPDLPHPILHDLPEEIPGERILLRAYRPGDGAVVWDAVDESREHLRPWLDWVDRHGSPDDSEAFARHAQGEWLLRKNLMAGIWERETGRLLGGSGLHPRDWNLPWFEIGYWLRPSAEGRGHVTEAVRLLCEVAFEALGAQRVHIQCDARNERSAAVPRRLGFLHEATLRNHMRSPDGELRDTLIFALTPTDYRAWKSPPGEGCGSAPAPAGASPRGTARSTPRRR